MKYRGVIENIFWNIARHHQFIRARHRNQFGFYSDKTHLTLLNTHVSLDLFVMLQ